MKLAGAFSQKLYNETNIRLYFPVQVEFLAKHFVEVDFSNGIFSNVIALERRKIVSDEIYRKYEKTFSIINPFNNHVCTFHVLTFKNESVKASENFMLYSGDFF